MLSAVILVLREVLEAAFIIALLIAFSHRTHLKRYWGVAALFLGVFMSWLLAHFAYDIADAMEGVGQELVNCVLYISVILCVNIINISILPWLFLPIESGQSFITLYRQASFMHRHAFYLYGLLVITVACVIAREGTEIWIYLASFISGNQDAILAAFLGGAIGAGIGISVGVLAYYIFVFMPGRIFLSMFLLATSLLVGGLALQVAKELMQIGWLESSQPLWDSSFLVQEHSLMGELLYALIGYEAKPTFIQGVFYLLAILPTLGVFFWKLFLGKSKQYV